MDLVEHVGHQGSDGGVGAHQRQGVAGLAVEQGPGIAAAQIGDGVTGLDREHEHLSAGVEDRHATCVGACPIVEWTPSSEKKDKNTGA
jgi:hypothetical protein